MENDLIRRSDAVRAIEENVLAREEWFSDCRAERNGLMTAIVIVDSISAVDAVEVRHGHWITEEEAIEKGDYSLRDTCSVCGHCDWDCTESENFNFCPNCGAKMDGEEDHNAKAD